MDRQSYLRIKEVMDGNEPADLLLRNCNIVNVFTGEIIHSNLAVSAGHFVFWSQTGRGKKEIDVKDRYVVPGLIDAHMHFESTMVQPRDLLAVAVMHGTTTLIADPHEAANVSGIQGIKYILDQTEDAPANVYVTMPSCVPATNLDDNGCDLTAEDMKPYVHHPRVLGLAEVMDAEAVLNADNKMFKKLELFDQNHIIDGHIPSLSGINLMKYSAAGIDTDHESIDFESALEKARLGIQVLIREGSAAHNVENLIKGILKSEIDNCNFSFCTDDRHVEDIVKIGHIDNNVRIAISLGMKPIDAIKIATINTARRYGLKHLGAIAPGYQADFIIVDNLKKFNVERVFVKGKEIKGKESFKKGPACPKELKHTVNISKITPEQFRLPIDDEPVHVISIVPRQITTEDVLIRFNPTENFKSYGDFKKIASIECHKNKGLIGVAITNGYGIQNGAIAISVAHDSHNIIVVGDNDKDMAVAANEIRRLQGGIVIVENGKVFDSLPLPIMGLISNESLDNVSAKIERLKNKAYEMGVYKDIDPFITLSFLSLPVIPKLRIIPRGLVSIGDLGPELIK
ncbi:Adenine deaminase [Succinivibrio dextrinosolvens DSM 3072]|uniref:Adenine deaminase n=1 Tax=Succinivibrio dextrinosolvens DSM 3072 TaxID=1123324 RepID=A0A1T4VCC5_9GAMM|nr:adenine deaminase [Succinivibrio dextrinosolvens]SKA62181.1 Adenine deaminase [Succinivibrio dextrinosolvens DSM 3072]